MLMNISTYGIVYIGLGKAGCKGYKKKKRERKSFVELWCLCHVISSV